MFLTVPVRQINPDQRQLTKSIERWILFKISNHKYHTIHREGVDLVTEDVARGLSDESIGAGSEFPRVYSTFSIVLINKRW